MLSLTKKQVKSLLEVISSDDTREVLTTAYIDKLNDKTVLVATDGYHLAAIELGDNVDHSETLGKFISRADLVKWYKLAATKDLFTDAEVIDLAKAVDHLHYPEWQKLIPAAKDFAPVANISLNATYMLTIQTLAAMPGMAWEFYGKLAPVVSRQGGSLYIVMPMKG